VVEVSRVEVEVEDGVVKFARARAHRVHELIRHVTGVRVVHWRSERPTHAQPDSCALQAALRGTPSGTTAAAGRCGYSAMPQSPAACPVLTR
jgi:hypothetical protein